MLLFPSSSPRTSNRLAAGFAAGLACLLFVIVSCAGPAAEHRDFSKVTPLKAWLGMSKDELLAIYPNLTQDSAAGNRYIRESIEDGLRGNWTYSFTDGVLRWFMFTSEESPVSRSGFNSYLNATSSLIDQYRGVFGEPKQEREGISEYTDPAIKPHEGYLVRQALWETDHGNVKVDFSFRGTGKSYAFLFHIQVSG